MNKYNGKVASKGYALGVIVEITHKNTFISKRRVDNVDKEIEKFKIALDKSIIELEMLYSKVVIEVGEDNASIFNVHKMLLEDPDYKGNIINIIKNNNYKAEYATDIVGKELRNTFSLMEDEYLKARAADFRDITKRVIKNILGKKQVNNTIPKNSIIVADDLDPSETIQLDKRNVIAFVTREGSVNSHTAILARTMNIPALVSTSVPYNLTGKQAIVNYKEFIISPDCNEIEKFNKEYNRYLEKRSLLLELKGKEVKTKSGKNIGLYANIGSVDDVDYVIDNDAMGIGLLRTEFLYLESENFPSEETQFESYKNVINKMGDKLVVIRTLDLGSDKQADYFQILEEENPALGYRAVRICLDKKEIFKTQLRAIYRCSTLGNIKVMFPLITSVWEVEEIINIVNEVKSELLKEGYEIIDIEIGITIETPAAVMIADELASIVDFFSIGTNDLTQYTLAVDRQNQKLDKYYDAYHPAVIKMIQMVIDACKKHGKKVGICGELGAHVNMTKKFIEMGIDELSVAPSMVLPIKKEILESE